MEQSLILKRQKNDKLRNTMIIGFILRISFLIFILTLGQTISKPYFILDDMKYEKVAEIYMGSANSVYDKELFGTMLRGFINDFWPKVTCVLAYIFKSAYAGRFLNVCLSTFCIYLVYKLTFEICENEVSALRAARVFAYLPLTIMLCCFPIKDIYITLGVTYAFYIFMLFRKNKKVEVWKIVLGVVLLIGVYYSRGAVVELMLIFGMIYLLFGLIRAKKYLSFLFAFGVCATVLYFTSGNIMEAFEIKVDDYGGISEGGNLINYVQIESPSQFYKFPFTYFFATIQPMTTKLFSINADNIWQSLMNNLNITMYPIAIGNFLYIFIKKKDTLFWASSFVMYSAVIILSLGIFRHYMFLLPVQIINYSICTIERKDFKPVIAVGTVALFLMVLLLSAVRI